MRYRVMNAAAQRVLRGRVMAQERNNVAGGCESEAQNLGIFGGIYELEGGAGIV